MRLYKSIALMFVLVIFMLTNVYADSVVFNAAKAYNYSSADYNTYLNKLVAKYPKLLRKEVIGYSSDKKPIVAIRMYTTYKEEDYANKTHILIEAGTHSREVLNTSIVLSMIEDYCRDYYNNSYISDINVKKELRDSVIHFIPLSNPDGHDLVKFGPKKIKNQSMLKKIPDKNYKRYKANINGVDLNRNYPDVYWNGTKWGDRWKSSKNKLTSRKPSGEFYGGPSAGSEIETRVVMKYLLRYDFRAVASFHSMGRVIYYDRPHLSDSFNEMSLGYAKIASSISGYQIMPREASTASGFLSHYYSNNTQKPVITIETTDFATPTPKQYYGREYKNHKLRLIPVKFLHEARRIGYYDYKVYKNGKYVTDLMDESYAQAVAAKIGGEVIAYQGKPYYSKAMIPAPAVIPEEVVVPAETVAPAPVESTQAPTVE